MTVSRITFFSGDKHTRPPLIVVLFFCLILSGKAQDNGERNSTSSNAAIEELIRNENDKDRKIKLANQYTEVVKRGGDPIEMADTYLFLSQAFSHSERAVAYTDSIIQVTKDVKNNTMYPAEGYLQKGIQLYYIADFDKALENYLKANAYFREQQNNFKQLVIQHYIGLLKNNIDETDEAFLIFKKNMKFFEDVKNRENYQQQYLKSLYAIAVSYVSKGKPDSALAWSKMGIETSLKTEDKYLYPYFLFSSGSSEELKKNYKVALDSILKGSSLILDKKKSLCTAYLNISEIYDSLNNKSKALEYLYKVDSVYQKEPQVIFKVRTAYDILLKKYQDEGNKDMQLETVKKMLTIDSLLELRPQNLSRKIVEQYDTPKLLYEKEKLIEELEEETNIGKTAITILGLLSVGLIFSVIYVTRKNIVHKKRFNSLMQEQKPQEKPTIEEKIAVVAQQTETVKKVTDLPDEVVQSILERLTRFETSYKFTNKQYTLSSLAKELQTNSAYLSKIINAEKKTSFAHYMNKLRIDYAIEKLKEDAVLRSYTIKAIANEFGFNTAQSFSNAFYKQTGIYPSFFIKQLEKDIDS